MICHKCGSENLDRASICSTCGATLIAMPKGSKGGIEPIPSTLLQPAKPRDDASAEPGPNTFDAEAYAAAIGPKANDYYLRQFASLHDGHSAAWHWPAFFVTLFWLASRRMWGNVGLYIVGSWLLTILGAGLAAVSPVLAGLYNLGLFIALFVVPALFANKLYYRHCTKLIEQTKRSARNRDHALGVIGGKGGTSGAAIAIVLAIMVIPGIGILAAIALPAYQDYTLRAKANEVVVSMAPSRVAVHEFYNHNGRLPVSLQETGMGVGAPSRYGSSVQYDATSGAITVHAVLSNTVAGAVVMKPKLSQGGQIRWSCGSPDLAVKYLPQSCRAGF